MDFCIGDYEEILDNVSKERSKKYVYKLKEN
jgi:hypothetical protein